MVDPLIITTIVASAGSLVISMFTHIKYSKCNIWGCDYATRTPQNTTPTVSPTTPLLRSQPINISK